MKTDKVLPAAAVSRPPCEIPIENSSAIFIPLKAQFFDAFARGEKTEELRLYGPRWNESACRIGRRVTLSRGYGKSHRLTGRIWKFKRQWGETFGSTYQESIKRIFGTTAVWIACISITDLQGATAVATPQAEKGTL